MKNLITLSLLLALTGCALPEVEEESTPVAVEESTEAEPEPAAPEPVEEPDTGDYRSEEHYTDEAVDTGDKMIELFGTMAEVFDYVATGVFTLDEGAELVEQAAATTQTHITFFEDHRPPERLHETNSLMLQALRLYKDSFETAARCMRTEQWDLCDESVDMNTEANRVLERAASALPY